MDDTYSRIQRFKRRKNNQLDLSCLNLTFIPNDVFSLEGIKELDLSNNLLISIDPRVGDLVEL
jgi:Leucine-rich repeat (LRR) protein